MKAKSDLKNHSLPIRPQLLSNRFNHPILLNDRLTIGSASYANLKLSDLNISKEHAQIERFHTQYLIKDLSRKFLTKVNGTPIKEALLSSGDRIEIGSYSFEFSLTSPFHEHHLQSKNSSYNKKLQKLGSIARSQFPVLINGPSGTGKELIAHSLHQKSTRKEAPFITINCSALSPTLIESELFGHKKGSFTGAEIDRKGAFEAAKGGTLFLDEIGDMPLSLQPKLLRAIEYSEIKPIGSDETIQTDVRIISATLKNLEELIEEKKFREDLFYRINVLHFETLPLKKRKEDLISLIYHFCKMYRISFSHSAIIKLTQHHWPGNIRQLKNTIAKASVLFHEQNRVDENDLVLLLPQKTKPNTKKMTPSLPLYKKNEFTLIQKKLKEHHGNQRQTALDLGMPKSTLHDKIKTYKIDVSEFQ